MVLDEVNTVDIKGKVLCKPRYLRRHPDKERPVATAEMREVLADKGCPSAAKMVRDHFSMIRGYGFNIVVNAKSGQSFTYSYFDDFSTPELLILSDAVSFSQFITKPKSEQLMWKLVTMAGPSYIEELQPNIFKCGICQSEKLIVSLH